MVTGFRPVLVKGIQVALTRRSDSLLTKLVLLSPRGRVRIIRTQLQKGTVACEFPSWVETRHSRFARNVMPRLEMRSFTAPDTVHVSTLLLAR